jgi:ribonuclease R
MRDKLGEEYGGMVNGVTSFGIFVQLDSLFIEGLVHVTELGSDYFQYDEIKNELRGERTGIRYRLSDRVRVQVSRVDLDARKIDFRLVRDTPIKPHPVRGAAAADKSSGENGGARVRALPPVEGGNAAGARRKKAAPAQSAAVKEARAARGAAKKHGAAPKPASKPTARKKR